MKSRPGLAIALCAGIFLLYLIANQEKNKPGDGTQSPGNPTQNSTQGGGQVNTIGQPNSSTTPNGNTNTNQQTTPPVELRPAHPDFSTQLTVASTEETGSDDAPKDLIALTADGKGVTEVKLPNYNSQESTLWGKDSEKDRRLSLHSKVDGMPQMLSMRIELLKSSVAVPNALNQLPELDKENWEKVSGDDLGWTIKNSIDELGKRSATGVEILQEVKKVPGQNHLNIKLTLTNRGAAARDVIYRLNGPLGLHTETTQGPGSDLLYFWGTDADVTDGRAAEIFVDEVSDLDQKLGSGSSANPVLVGLSNNYFAAILMAVDKDGNASNHLRSVHLQSIVDSGVVRKLAVTEYPGREFIDLNQQELFDLREKAYRTAAASVASRTINLAPGASVDHHYRLYLGSRDSDTLNGYVGFNLSETNYFGWFTVVVNLFMGILSAIYVVLPSWGLCIVILTLIVRTCLHPINRKQQLGMARFQKKMQKVQPIIKEIQEKHKGDRMKTHQEMQRVFKENDVNQFQMMGGCLMIFLQLPIWIGLIRTFQYSLELRHEAFLWIPDLTAPDRTFDLGSPVFFIGSFINILPIIYVVLMLINQKLQPKATDPQMAQTQRMMSFMMIAFGFIFYSFASGLLIYFIVSALYGIVESRMIKRIIAKEDAEREAGGGTVEVITPTNSPQDSGNGGMYSSSMVGKRKKPTKAERQKAKGMPKM